MVRYWTITQSLLSFRAGFQQLAESHAPKNKEPIKDSPLKLKRSNPPSAQNQTVNDLNFLWDLFCSRAATLPRHRAHLDPQVCWAPWAQWALHSSIHAIISTSTISISITSPSPPPSLSSPPPSFRRHDLHLYHLILLLYLDLHNLHLYLHHCS